VADPSLIAKILDAQYEADHCAPREQAAKMAAYLKFLDEAVEGKPYSRLILVEALKDRYKEYRRARRKADGIPARVENQLTEEDPTDASGTI
jgi:hypothetical protein